MFYLLKLIIVICLWNIITTLRSNQNQRTKLPFICKDYIKLFPGSKLDFLIFLQKSTMFANFVQKLIIHNFPLSNC